MKANKCPKCGEAAWRVTGTRKAHVKTVKSLGDLQFLDLSVIYRNRRCTECEHKTRTVELDVNELAKARRAGGDW